MSRTITLNKTYAEMQALIAASGLNTQTFYKITNRGDNGLLFRASAVDKLEFDGIRYMLCPATYAAGADAHENDWIGVWNATKQISATEGQLSIWNGLVWTAGVILAGTSPNTPDSGWTAIPKASFTNHEYIEMIFGVSYDFDNDWINKQWDGNGNYFGLSKSGCVIKDISTDVNLIDLCDWNLGSTGEEFHDNNCLFIFNNSNIGGIYNNEVSQICRNYNGWHINNNNNKGDIRDNLNDGKIAFNFNLGDISENSNTNEILLNGNCGEIRGNSFTVGRIDNNHNNGTISVNTTTGDIINNQNNGHINQNSCTDIMNNINNGDIHTNAITGNIYWNKNNGGIFDNSEIVAGITIQHNINNGPIYGIWDADVTDTVIDKTGTAGS